MLAVVVEQLGCHARVGEDQGPVLGVFDQDEGTVIPKSQLLARLDDGRLADGLRVQRTKLDPWQSLDIKLWPVEGSQFQDGRHGLEERSEHLGGRHRVLDRLPSNVLAGERPGSHGGGGNDGWEVSSPLLICLVQGKIESIIRLTLCVVDDFRGSGAGTQIGRGVTRSEIALG